MSLAQTPPGAPPSKAVAGGARLSGAAGGGLPWPGKVRDAEHRRPHERACLAYVGAGASSMLPLFCPTDLHRAARTRISLNDQSSFTSADQYECDPEELGRTDLDGTHPAETARSTVRSHPARCLVADDRSAGSVHDQTGAELCWSALGPHCIGNRRLSPDMSSHDGHGGTAGQSIFAARSTAATVLRLRVRTPQPNCRGPAALANEASGSPWTGFNLRLSLWPSPRHRTSFVLAGLALRVPVASVPDCPIRTTAVGRDKRLSCVIGEAFAWSECPDAPWPPPPHAIGTRWPWACPAGHRSGRRSGRPGCGSP
jgi:hypothetical protein